MAFTKTKTVCLTLIGLLALGIPLANLTTVTGTVSAVPIVSVDSPIQNHMYEEREVWLNFTIIRPDSWTEPTIGNPILLRNLGKITHLTCIVDGIKSENVTVDDNDVHTIPLSIKKTFNFSFPLTDLSTGEHSIQVIVYGEVYVSGGTHKNCDDPVSPIVTSPVIANSSIINFTLGSSTKSSSGQNQATSADNLIGIISGVVISISILMALTIYLKKHKRTKDTPLIRSPPVDNTI